MKILFCGDFKYWGLTTTIKRVFEDLGHDTIAFDYRKFKSEEYNGLLRKFPASISEPMRIVVPIDFTINRMFYNSVKKNKPDAIFILKGETISVKTIKKIKKHFPDIIITNWYPDNPFVMWNSSVSAIESIREYDIYFSWGKFLIPTLKSVGAKRVEYLPFGCDEKFLGVDEKLTDDDIKKYSCDVIFVGTWSPQREFYLSKITDFNLKIYGDHWNKASSPVLKERIAGGPIFTSDMTKAFKCSKLVLNFIRTQNGDANNMRTFEVPCVGSVLLTTRTKEQCEELFTEGKEIIAFETPEELREKIKYYLKKDKEREMIRINGQKKCIKEHNYHKRMSEVIKAIEEEIQKKKPAK